MPRSLSKYMRILSSPCTYNVPIVQCSTRRDQGKLEKILSLNPLTHMFWAALWRFDNSKIKYNPWLLASIQKSSLFSGKQQILFLEYYSYSQILASRLALNWRWNEKSSTSYWGRCKIKRKKENETCFSSGEPPTPRNEHFCLAFPHLVFLFFAF